MEHYCHLETEVMAQYSYNILRDKNMNLYGNLVFSAEISQKMKYFHSKKCSKYLYRFCGEIMTF